MIRKSERLGGCLFVNSSQRGETNENRLIFMNYTKNIKEHQLTRIGWDLDNTLAKQRYPKKGIGKPIKETTELLKKLLNKGYKNWIYTVRPSYDFINIKNWHTDNAVPISGIECGKDLFLYYVDDRAINPYCKECVGRLKKETGIK